MNLDYPALPFGTLWEAENRTEAEHRTVVTQRTTALQTAWRFLSAFHASMDVAFFGADADMTVPPAVSVVVVCTSPDGIHLFIVIEAESFWVEPVAIGMF